MKVLVTGGAGLIGSAVVKSLNDQGVTDIVIVDRLGKTDKWRNLVGLAYNQYLDVDEWRETMRQSERYGHISVFDAVVHLGACSSTTETDASYLVRNNLTFSTDLCRYAFSIGARFVYASSAATYGLDGHMSDADDLNVLRPLNAYGWSKHSFDQWAARQGHLEKIVGLKYFNVFGPGEAHKGDMRSVVAKGYDEIRATGKMTLFDMPTDRPIGRDFLYVKDAAAITTWFVLNEMGRKATGLFNVGSGIASTWDQLAEALFDALEKPIEIPMFEGPEYTGDLSAINRIPMPDHLKGKYQYYTKANISCLRAAGYNAPITPLSDAVKDYVTNYLIPDRRIGT
jgi:ADP-L-glycero-D-manno-heptose 6-epimerase